MARNRTKAKGRREGHSFAGIPHAVLKTRKYASLSAWAVKLLVDVTAQYTSRNNGDLQAAWTCMRERGWKSKGTLERSVRELESVGFILRTRKGGRNKCALFAITWQPIDECLDRRSRISKLDPNIIPGEVAPGTWRDEN